MKKIILCPPTYYDIEYEINPWMHLNEKVDKEQALKEYESLKAKYKELGQEFIEVEPQPGLPDMVYINDEGYGEGKKFLKSNFRYSQRKKEAEFTAEYMKKLGYEVVSLPESIIWEGQGDLMRTNKMFFLGWGKRSNKEAAQYIQDTFKKPVITFELHDPYFYHLDTCFAPLTDDTVMINQKAFEPKDLQIIHENFKTVIETNDQDNKVLGCNLIMVDKNIVVNKGLSQETKQTLSEHGFSIHDLNMNEFVKGGGCIKCMSLQLFE